MTYDRDTLFKALDGTVSPVAQYRYPIGEWTEHLETFAELGFKLTLRVEVPTDRIGYGANRQLRVDHETVAVLVREGP